MNVRPLAPRDIDALTVLEKECFFLPWTAQNFMEELANPSARFFVAHEEDRIAGYVGAVKVCDEYDLFNVAVAADFRRVGVASRLLEELIRTANAEGIYRFTLEVRVTNKAAIALYAKFGFRPSGVRPNYYVDGEDALIMWKE